MRLVLLRVVVQRLLQHVHLLHLLLHVRVVRKFRVLLYRLSLHLREDRLALRKAQDCRRLVAFGHPHVALPFLLELVGPGLEEVLSLVGLVDHLEDAVGHFLRVGSEGSEDLEGLLDLHGRVVFHKEIFCFGVLLNPLEDPGR